MRILKLSQRNLEEIVKVAVKSIKQGKALVCPTDTVYGLIADATNERAVEKVLKIKRRKAQKPIPIFVKDIKMAKKLAKIDKKQEEFLKSVWPGKVTTILKAKSETRKIFPKGIISSENKIGFRIPKYRLVNVLLKKFNLPLTGTSANISGQPPSTKIKEVISQFKSQKYQLDLILDAGNLPKSKPSTVLDLTKFPPKILRQ